MPELPTDFRIPTANDAALTECPHCGGRTRLVPDDRFRWACGSCGGARVPSPDPRAHSAAEKQHLLQSAQLVTKARVIGLGGSVTAIGATGAALFAMLLIFGAHVGGIVPLLFIGISGFFSVLTIALGRNARAKLDEAKTQVTEAWQKVVEGLMRLHGRALTAAEIGTMLNTTEADAERLLTLLSVEDKVQSAVTSEDAQIRYTLPAHLRVEDPVSMATAHTVLAPRVEESASTVLAPRIEESAEERDLAARIEQASAKAARTEPK